MTAIGSLSTAWTAFRTNSVILVGALAIVVLGQLPTVLDAFVHPLAGTAMYGVAFFVSPFLIGGLLTMAAEALSGSTGMGSLVRGGKEHYVRLLLATIVFAGIVFGMSVGGSIAVLVAVLGAFATGGVEGMGLALVVGVGAVVFLAMLVMLMLLQFFSPAIVVSDLGVLDSFARSVSVVRANLLGVVGFSIVYLTITAVGQLPGFALYFTSVEFTETGATEVVSESGVALSVALTLSIGTVALGYAYTYLVAYYSSLAPDAPTA